MTFYTDSHGSKADPKLEAENDDLNKPITDFLRYAETQADSAFGRDPTPGLACAFGTFEAWSAADALSAKAETRQAAIDQVGFVAALNVLALKFEADGLVLTAADLSWLNRLNRPVIDGSRKSSTRTNLYSWIGFGAAAAALVTGDEDAKRFQNEVWRYAIAAIDARGYVETEVSRGGRALIYHQFDLSALLMLREARRKLLIDDDASDLRALKRLSDEIAGNLCHQDAMTKLAQAPQEMPGEWGYRVAFVFGADLLSPDWKLCGVYPKSFFDILHGGDLRTTLSVLRR